MAIKIILSLILTGITLNLLYNSRYNAKRSTNKSRDYLGTLTIIFSTATLLLYSNLFNSTTVQKMFTSLNSDLTETISFCMLALAGFGLAVIMSNPNKEHSNAR